MKTMLAIFLTILCWGCYGPILHVGQHATPILVDGQPTDPAQYSRLLPFIGVGMAYFIIAVVVPMIYLFLRQEQGSWTTTGTVWSLAAGAAGAIGALGIIMALANGGSPLFVMPLVFGLAPVVNAFFTIFMGKALKQIGPIFLAGLIMVVIGAFTAVVANQHGLGVTSMNLSSMIPVLLWIGVVALSWGAYGPVLHKGQMKMGGSRLRPLICVGLAYFAIAVLVPWALLGSMEPHAEPTFSGSAWSLGAGSAGAIGALGIIMAFNFGGKPVYVMPLVFGGAPIVNTFVSIFSKGTGAPTSPLFYAGLILTAAGAVVVLIFAPRGGHAPPAPKKTPAPAAS